MATTTTTTSYRPEVAEVSGSPFERISWGGVIAGLALLSTTLGYILYYRILARSGSTNLMLVTFLMPVTAILLGALAQLPGL